MGGWVPEFSFSDEKRLKVAALVGEDNVGRVEKLYAHYLAICKKEESKLSVARFNKELQAVGDSALIINDALKRDGISERLDLLINKKSTGMMRDLRKILQEVLLVTEGIPATRAGRAPGDGKYADWFLINGIYPLCRELNKGPLSIVDSGTLLHNLVTVLLDDKAVGAKVRKVIKDHRTR